MLPNWLRLLIALLLTLLVLNALSTLPQRLKEPADLPLLELNRTYTCEVDKGENCLLECYETNTATLLVLKPKDCTQVKKLKRGDLITFKVAGNSYYRDGSIPVILLQAGGN